MRGANERALQRMIADDDFAYTLWARVVEKLDRSGGPLSCWRFTGKIHAPGYATVGVFNNGEVSKPGVHRIMFVLSNRRLPVGGNVCHQCDNPPCCNPAHLFEGTTQDNLADMRQKGRWRTVPSPSGEYAYRVVFTAQQALDIVRLHAGGDLGWAEIAAQVGVPKWHVRNVLHGYSWRTVTGLSKKPSEGKKPPPARKGSQHPNSRYSEEDIRRVDLLMQQGLSNKEIEVETGVGMNTIFNVRTGLSWGWLTGRKRAA